MGPTVTRPVQDPLAVLSLNNRLSIATQNHISPTCVTSFSNAPQSCAKPEIVLTYKTAPAIVSMAILVHF